MFENNSIKKIKPYKLSSHKIWDYVNDKNALKLDWNEATIKPSPLVINAIKNEIDNARLNWYPDVNNEELIKLIANYNNLSINQVQYFASSDCLHEYIVRCFVEKNDKILVVGPTYDNFRAVAESNGGNIINFYLKDNFVLDFEKLKGFLSKQKPSMLYIVNPNNPTGTIHDVKKLNQIITKFKNILFVVDEAYFEFSGVSISDKVSTQKNIIISRTFSKAFALASFRIGYVISNQMNIETLNKIRNPKNISHFAQIAAIAALNDLDYTLEYSNEINKSKKILLDFLKKIISVQAFSGSGNFVFLKVFDLDVKKKLLDFLSSNKIFIRDYGHIDQTKNFVRITLGTIKQTNIVVETLNKFFKK